MERWNRETGETKDSKKPDNEIAEVIKHLNIINPDILGVCELGSKEDFEDFRAKLAKSGLKYKYFTRCFGPGYGKKAHSTRSLALLSKYKIVKTNNQMNLKYKIGNQVLPVQRGFLDATVMINKKMDIRLIGVHLKSKHNSKIADQELMRRNESQLLREHVDNIIKENPKSKLLIYGDFNFTKNEIPFKVIVGKDKKLKLYDIFLHDKNDVTWTHYWKRSDIYSRIDFVFVNKSLFKNVALDKSYLFYNEDYYLASDHRPLVVTIATNKLKSKKDSSTEKKSNK